jgi:Mg/Co/Ni transporter MgtE
MEEVHMRLLRWASMFAALPMLLGQTGCDPASFIGLFVTSLVQSVTYSLVTVAIQMLSRMIFPTA